MTLELSKVAGKIDAMGQALAERSQRERRVLPAALELLQLFAEQRDWLCEIADSEAGQRLRCASPGSEPLGESWPAPTIPEQVTIIAADGSQIFPDRHGLAFYYVVNVGGIIFRHGSGRAPDVVSEPRLSYADDQVYPGGRPVSGDMVSVERDLAEIRMLAQLAEAEPSDGPPCVALADGPLLIWLRRAGVSEEQQARVLEDYLLSMDRLRACDAAAAGFVSRPRSAEVVALLCLAYMEPGERESVGSLAETQFRGLTDGALFGNLPEGHRSALFVRGTAVNRDFRAKGHAIYFFYLNTGLDLARVEIPEWIAKRSELVDLVHSVVQEQCRFNNGYPYVLTRADEQAVILGEEREVLEGMIARALVQHGLSMPELSRKAQQKQAARWRRGS